MIYELVAFIIFVCGLIACFKNIDNPERMWNIGIVTGIVSLLILLASGKVI